MIEHFHFIRPYFLLLLFVVIGLMWVLYKHTQKNNAWSDFCDPQLLSFLLVGTEKKASKIPLLLMFIVGVLIVVAMAGPTWKKLPQAVYKKEAARVFILDLSRSMDATDVQPNRASRAKLKLIDLLKASNEGQVALIVYAAEPHIVSPLTDDSETIAAMIPSLSTAIMPAQGSRTDRAILKAAQLLTQAGSFDGEIILLGDGSNGAKAIEAAEKVAQGGYSFHVMGVGTEQGSPIPVRSGGFLKDKSGAIVIPKLNRSGLKELALAGSGRYIDLAVDDSDVEVMIQDTLNTQVSQDNPLTREVDLWQDEGHWFLIFALPFAALGFRRGWLTVVVFSVCYLPQGDLYAFEWKDMWQTKDQQAQERMKSGDFEQAAQLYENQNWKGAALYKNGNFEQAADAFAESSSFQSNYNRANALARQGRLEEAIEAYDEVLKVQSEHEDATFNKELVKNILDNQKQKPAGDEKNPKDQNGEGEDQQEQESKQQQQSNADQSESDEQEQQNQSQSNQENEEQDQESEQQQAQQNENDENKEDQDKAEQQEQIAKGDEEQEQQKPEQSEEELQEQKEIQQATQQWLRRIPDDPGGLLREKFSRQHQRQRQRQQVENPW